MKLSDKAQLSRVARTYQEGWRDGFKAENEHKAAEKNSPWYPVMYKLGFKHGREARKAMVTL